MTSTRRPGANSTPVLLTWLALGAGLLLVGCGTTTLTNDEDAGSTPTVTTDAGTSPGTDAGTANDAGAGGDPKSCTATADCALAGACPPDATKGCTCADTPQGKRCVPQCSTASDCPQPPGKTLICDNGLCREQGGGGPGDGGQGGPTGMTITTTVSDQAQSMTIAFDGLAFVTGSFCTQTFYPPGKVADFFGFQYLRDNDPTNLGHNTEFTTLTADPMLALLDNDQLTVLASLGNYDQPLAEAYGRARFPLALGFRRLFDGATPAGHPALDPAAVRAFSASLFAIDGQMSVARAQAYASVLNSMTPAQKTVLAGMKGKGAGAWTQPSASVVAAALQAHPSKGDLRTFAGEMLAWYLGDVASDVYFCPERQGTYFGSFFMKDVKAMHNPNTTIDSNMTANMGDAFLATLDATTQRPAVSGLVAAQKADLTSLVEKRIEISEALRVLLASGSVSTTGIVNLSRQYGELDGQLSYLYATAFSGLNLTPAQKSSLMALRKTATAEDGGTPDYDAMCGNGYLYSAPLQTAPTVMNTDFLFGVCQAQGVACSSDWDCCSYHCLSNACTAPFVLTSSVATSGGALPATYTCDGAAGMSSPNPPLAWTGVPAGTTELALTMTTVALDGTKYNWVLFHIPVGTTALASGTTVGTNGVSTDGPLLKYYPPCSTGPGLKSYTFTLYALSGAPSFSVPESQVTGPLLEAAVAPLTLGTTQLTVTYTRP